MRFEETDVVIVGGGVAGFAMAIEAFRRGLRARVLSREQEAATAALLGAVYQPAALACFAALGVYDPMRSAGAVLDRLALYPAGASQPAAVLEYGEAGEPFPHALGIVHAAFQETCRVALARYAAIRIEQGVELLSLLHERGRVAGAVARDPASDVTYRAKVVVVTTSEGGAPVRAELGAAARFLPYPDEQASLLAERPERWPGEVRSWLGPGLAVTAYPVSEARLRIEATAPAGAVGAGLEELRRLLAAAAPPLESALKSLSSTSAVHRRPIARSRVRSRVSDAVALTGSAARAMSPLGLNVESQAVLDAAALAGVLSRCQFTGDFSRPALRPYEEARRPAAEGAARLSHDLHRLGLARSGLYARARRAALDRLARSPVLRRKLVRALAGVGEPLALGDRLRVGGLLPLSA